MSEVCGMIQPIEGPYWRRWLLPRLIISAVVLSSVAFYWVGWQLFRFIVHLAMR